MRTALLTATALVALSSLAVAQNQIDATREAAPKRSQSIATPWLIPQCPRADCTMMCLAEYRQWVHASLNRRHIRYIGQDPDSNIRT